MTILHSTAYSYGSARCDGSAHHRREFGAAPRKVGSAGLGSASSRACAPQRSERAGALTRLIEELAAPTSDSTVRWHPGLLPGAAVGRFHVVREVGRGGVGVVYEALDSLLRRPVALKTVCPGEPLRERMWRHSLRDEAHAAARLAHPNIVKLFDVGTHKRAPYLVLELLHGETLQGRLLRGPLPLGEALRIAIEMARALEHAHARGVLHCDIKPSNVFLTREGAIKVLDFGLAQVLGHRAATGGGTPAYMAPEQRRRKAGRSEH